MSSIHNSPLYNLRRYSISLGSVRTILRDYLHISYARACWIPCLLILEQKQRVEVCEYWSECVCAEGDEEWKMIIIEDECCVYPNDPTSKQQNTEWVQKGQGPLKKGRATEPTNKMMVVTFFNYHGTMYSRTYPKKNRKRCAVLHHIPEPAHEGSHTQKAIRPL